jgi:hypothetical protein
MKENQEQHAEGIKGSIESILGSAASLKRRRKTEIDIQKEQFEQVIFLLEKLNVRSELLGTDFSLDLTSYDNDFYNAIDILLEMMFGKEIRELIFFYLYDRVLANGDIQELTDVEGNPIRLNTSSDLWNLIIQVQAHESNPKKK